MTVFKKYLKIANTYTLMILAYTAIFLGLAIFTGTYNSTSTDYKSMDVKVAAIFLCSNRYVAGASYGAAL